MERLIREPLADRDQALAGPRQLKEAGSPEWCWQTVSYLKDYMRHVHEQWRQAEQVLDELLRARAWLVIPPEKPYGTLNAMLKAEVGLDERALKDLIRKAELAAHGGDRKSVNAVNQADNVSLIPRDYGNSETYTIRRLRRDRPDLAERVDRHEMSANKAAITAGWRRKTISIPVTKPDAVADSLLKHMSFDDLAKLIARLAELLTKEQD